jgi:hypothetical protein
MQVKNGYLVPGHLLATAIICIGAWHQLSAADSSMVELLYRGEPIRAKLISSSDNQRLIIS